MPTNNFKLFDENKANMMTDEEYAQNAQRLNGVQSGVASSQLQNKTLYQTALMCYALAQLMAANGFDANDANAVSTFVNNLSSSVLQKVADKASAADIANKVAGKWVDSSIFGQNMQSLGETYLKLAGGTMTGNLILNGDPTLALQAATKQYVDVKAKIAAGSYVGTGTYGSSHPTVINCGFKPKILAIFFNMVWNVQYGYYISVNGGDYSSVSDAKETTQRLSESGGQTGSYSLPIDVSSIPAIIYFENDASTFQYSAGRTGEITDSVITKFSASSTSVSFYCESHRWLRTNSGSDKLDGRSAAAQFNESGTKYYWTAIG